MNPQQAAREIEKRARDLKRQAQKAQQQTAKAAVDAAKSYSRGPYKSAQLAKMGHPYAKSNPSPPLPPGFINYQSGGLYRGWRRKYKTYASGEMVATVFNIAPEAVFLDPKLQTSKNTAIGRPIVAYITLALQKPYPLIARERIKEALKL